MDEILIDKGFHLCKKLPTERVKGVLPMSPITYVWDGKVVVLQALARKLKKKGVPGASVGNLSRVFRGLQPTNVHLIQAIAEVMEMSMEDVMRELEESARNAQQPRELPLMIEEV